MNTLTPISPSIPDARYIYRFDSFESLRSQRRYDRRLRGRYATGNEETFHHHQVKVAQLAAPENAGVYRLSFWKSWDALRLNLWAQRKSVIQRVRIDHPVLQEHFTRGDDQYLEREAWLYWATLPIDLKNPEWSPVGIPHEDIEVLHPHGRWLGMDEIPELGETASAGWETYRFQTYDRSFPIHAAVGKLASGDEAVLLRKPIGPHPNSYSTLAPYLHEVVSDLVRSGRTHQIDVRWFLALESHNFVSVEELSMTIEKQGGWSRRLRAFLTGREVHPELIVGMPQDGYPLDNQAAQALYDAFGIGYATNYTDFWTYPHLVPSQAEVEQIKERLEIGAPVIEDERSGVEDKMANRVLIAKTFGELRE